MGTKEGATGDAAANATEQRKTSAGRTGQQIMTAGAINVVMRRGGGALYWARRQQRSSYQVNLSDTVECMHGVAVLKTNNNT